jgi:hypothetical protein
VDIGAADEIHGESGDDSIYGMFGDDVLFGDSEDDDVTGGWGADWVSGGTGRDGVLGDDGRIFTARFEAVPNGDKVPDPTDPEHFAEPLYGVLKVDEVNKPIATPGDIQQATIHPDGELFKSVDLTPFNLKPNAEGADDPLFEPKFANDIVFGGLGNDFLHGGAGDDAISGAEATSGAAGLFDFFAEPTNPGDLLRFDPNRVEFADYDEDAPRTRLVPFLLDFDPDRQGDEDEDALFGDLGNDWLGGGPDNDQIYGGFGADLLDADDDHGTNGGLNDQPDPPNVDIQDIAFGGAGRDVLIANTGGDRLIDWAGEFNSFLVPFAPYGAFTISRGVPPHLFEFLYDLSAADGADPTRAADTGKPGERNGEPEGELGLVTQKDDAWSDQTGAPMDPQPGNIPGGERLTVNAADFNDSSASAGFAPDSGTWRVSGGRFEVAPTALGGDAASVFHVGDYLPSYFEMKATINADKDRAGYESNAFLIFDYQGPTDFKFAGVNPKIDKLQIGHRTEEGWIVDVQSNMRLRANTDYRLLLALNGTTATLVVDGKKTLSHAFAARLDEDGFSYGLNAGMIGLGAENSVARIDDVVVQILKPETTFEHVDDFSDGVADGFTAPTTGLWQVNGESFEGTSIAATGPLAATTFDLRVSPNSRLELEATLTAETLGGFFFDAYSEKDFKFAAILPEANLAVIGHWSKQGQLKYDAFAQLGFAAGPEFDLRLSLKGTTVSLAVDGHEVLGHVFNAVSVDGAFGLMSAAGKSSFDRVAVRTDDPAFSEDALASATASASAESSSATSGSTTTTLDYAVRVLAAESWSEEDEESDEFAITEIPLDPDEEPDLLS